MSSTHTYLVLNHIPVKDHYIFRSFPEYVIIPLFALYLALAFYMSLQVIT